MPDSSMRRILNSSVSALALAWEAEKASPYEGWYGAVDRGYPGVMVEEYIDPKTKKPMVAMDFETRGLGHTIFNTSDPTIPLNEISDRRFFVYDPTKDTPSFARDYYANGGGVGFDVSSYEGLHEYQRLSLDQAVRGGDRTAIWPPIFGLTAQGLTPTGRIPTPPSMIVNYPRNHGATEAYKRIRDLILDHGVVIPHKSRKD